MPHAHIPDFSQPLGSIAPDADRRPFHLDPILTAIDRHSEAWSVFQVASDGEAAIRAEDDADGALMALLGTPCATRGGMLCLIRYLRWCLAEEAPDAVSHGDAWAIVQAREGDLSFCLGVEPVRRLPMALPSGRLLGPMIDLRPPLPPAKYVGRALAAAGELLTAIAIVAGGSVVTGLATLF